MAGFGMTEAQWAASRPPLSPANQLVMQVWNFCGGWHPELIPYAAEYFGARDVDFLTHQLLVLRSTLDAHVAAVRKAQGSRG